jgi:hypothetical protein
MLSIPFNPAEPRSTTAPVAAPADTVEQILKVLRAGERFLVCSHSRPDGDAVGSMLAMGNLLEQMGKRADLVAADRVPAVYRGLPGADRIRSAMRVHGPYDAVILLECDGLERAKLRGMEPFFLINIDHHVSGRPFAHLNWIDCQAASTGLRASQGCWSHGDAGDGDLPLHHGAYRYRGILLRVFAGLHVWPGARPGSGRGRPCPGCPERVFFNSHFQNVAAGRSAQ